VKSVVVDASFAGAWMLPDESSEEAERLLRDVLEEKCVMVVPVLWRYEMCNLIRSALARERLDEDDAGQALDLLHRVPKQVFDHQEDLFQRRLMIMATRFALSAYDAAYLELADRLQCALYTNDNRLREAAETFGLGVKGEE
jgi:predicted nucleic acid-binding protein